MEPIKQSASRKTRWTSLAALTTASLASWSPAALATQFNTSADWDIELDNTISYSLGFRAEPRNSLISNNPIQQNNEYKFANLGNVTSDRFEYAPELSVAYQKDTGLDVSFDMWKDFAYNGGVKTNPAEYAPGVSYSSLSSSPSGNLGSYTNHLYNLGGELENAFVFKNVTVWNMPLALKVGRFTEYWGNALFSGGQSISYGQSPVDYIKAVDSPGTEVKDLFMPRGQASAHLQVTPALTLGFQYQFEYRYDRNPEGGTFLGIADPFFIGATTIEGGLHRGSDAGYSPPNVDGNLGAEILYSPTTFNGTIGAYYRQFDDVDPYSAFATNVEGPDPTYHLAYARHIHLYGLSLDNNTGPLSTSFEVSIRQNTGLATVAGSDPIADPLGKDGARGTTLNALANAIYGLTPNRLWQTGSIAAELAFTHVLAVTHDAARYQAIGYACSAHGLSAGDGTSDGCSTSNELNLNFVFDPQWLQVFPQVDLDAPVSVGVGLIGSGQTFAIAATGDVAGSIAYSVGVHALISQKYSVKLDYSGFQSPTGKIANTPSGLAYYSTGAGTYMWNDKGQVQLVLSTSF